MRKDIGFNHEVISCLFQTICKIATQKPKEPLPVQEVTEEMENYDELVESNERIKQENE